MTIAAGFQCRDGMVFASDSLFTGATRSYCAKTWGFRAGDSETVIALSGAGTAILIRRIREEIKNRLAGKKPTTQEIIQHVDSVLFSMLHKSRVDPDDFAEVLLAIRTPTGFELHENQRG